VEGVLGGGGTVEGVVNGVVTGGGSQGGADVNGLCTLLPPNTTGLLAGLHGLCVAVVLGLPVNLVVRLVLLGKKNPPLVVVLGVVGLVVKMPPDVAT